MRGPGELDNEFSWSKSRDALFKTCLRAYYYHYYGSWNGWRHDAPGDVRELYVMKNLQALSTWRGSVVHDVAEQVVKGLRNGCPVSVESALTLARESLVRDLEDSRTGRYRRRPNRICGLMEHYYEVSVSAEELQEVTVVVEGCLRRLYGTRSYQTMLELGPESIAECEELRSFTLSGNKVWVSADVIVRSPENGLSIVDWKTGGSSPSEETRLQLAIYGLYAVRTYGFLAQPLLGIEENLRLGEEHVYPLDERVLERASEYVEDSILAMKALLHDRDSNTALFRDFPMTDDLALCTQCRFRRACDRG
jgi:hypothetical protein